ncbi:hypothetical protein [Deinococcus apachensis]|uniref:hypothetical protein n=1 Tax=Deinococcus apachensis TaxID=309886 RepID=UPI000381D4FE|nr:hypothetical protein [Deinococcus apachensis]
MARQKRDDLPDWLNDDVIFAELAERELADRGALPEPEETGPLTLREFAHKFWDVLEPGTPLAWGWVLDAMCLHLEAAARRPSRWLRWPRRGLTTRRRPARCSCGRWGGTRSSTR